MFNLNCIIDEESKNQQFDPTTRETFNDDVNLIEPSSTNDA